MSDPQMQARARKLAPALLAVVAGNFLLLASRGLRTRSQELIFGQSGAFWHGVVMGIGMVSCLVGVALLVAAIMRMRADQAG